MEMYTDSSVGIDSEAPRATHQKRAEPTTSRDPFAGLTSKRDGNDTSDVETKTLNVLSLREHLYFEVHVYETPCQTCVCSSNGRKDRETLARTHTATKHQVCSWAPHICGRVIRARHFFVKWMNFITILCGSCCTCDNHQFTRYSAILG